MVTQAINKYSVFGGATLGAAAYATAFVLSPAMIGALTFSISNFFVGVVGTVGAVALGYALPVLASIAAGVMLAIAFNALFNLFAGNKKAQEALKTEVTPANAKVDAADATVDAATATATVAVADATVDATVDAATATVAVDAKEEETAAGVRP